MTTRLCSLAGTAALLLLGAPRLVAAQDVTIAIRGGPQIDGDGVVTSSPAGISCTITYPATTGTCAAAFPTGTVVTLTAAPAPLNTFGTWNSTLCGSSPTCQFTANQNATLVPTFDPARFPLTIVGAGIGYGLITGNATHEYFGAGNLNCEIRAGVTSGSCTTQYAVNRPIEIRISNLNNLPLNVTLGAPCVNQSRCEAIMPAGPVTIVATLNAAGFRILSGGGSGAGNVNGASKSTAGTVAIDCAISAAGATGTCGDTFASKYQDGPVTLTATPSPGSQFVGWSGSCSGTGTCVFDGAGTSIVDLVADFATAPTQPGSVRVAPAPLNDGDGVVTSSPAGINCIVSDRATTGTCTAEFPQGTTVTLTATPAAGNTLAAWDACAATPTCQVTASPGFFTGVRFNPTRATLTIVGGGVGRVRIVGDHTFDFLGVPDIGCTVSGGVAAGACTTQFPVNKRVTLRWENSSAGVSTLVSLGAFACSAAPPFACSGIMPAEPLTLVATVTAPAFRVVGGSGGGQGRVASSSVGTTIDCTVSPSGVTGMCADDFGSKDLPQGGVVLQATPAPGSRFSGWSGSGGCSGTGTCVFNRTVVGLVDMVATFEPATATLNVTGDGTGNGVVTSSTGGLSCVVTKGAANSVGCSTVSPEGSPVTLTADPQGGSVFAGWAGDGCSGVALACTLTLSETRNVVARFTAPRPGRDVAMALLGGPPLDADERAQLDRFGNKDGIFNLGDLLALLDRTGEHLTPATTAALLEADRRAP